MTDNPTIQQVEADVSALDDALVEKGIERPSCDYTVRDRSFFYLSGRGLDSQFFRGEYPDALAAAKAYIAALPSPEAAVLVEYQKKVAGAVDYATEHALDEKIVAPLRGVSEAIHENLLTHQEARQ